MMSTGALTATVVICLLLTLITGGWFLGILILIAIIKFLIQIIKK